MMLIVVVMILLVVATEYSDELDTSNGDGYLDGVGGRWWCLW